MKKCEKDSKFNEKSVKKVAAASCCAVFGRNGEGKRERGQTESRRKLGLTKGEMGQTDEPLDKTKISVYGRRKRKGQTEDKQKRSNLDLVFFSKILFYLVNFRFDFQETQ